MSDLKSNKPFGVTGFSLKLLAIAGMTVNHVANVFAQVMPGQITLALYAFGGLTFPVMSFLLVEGYLHTSSLRNYAARLFGFAAIAQVPYTLCFGWGDVILGSVAVPTLNVLFTLLISLGLLWVFDNVYSQLLRLLALLSGVSVSVLCDWPLLGPVLTLLFFLLRNRGRAGVVFTMLVAYVYVLLPNIAGAASGDFACMADVLYAAVGFTLATCALCLYNGRRGYPMKWFFYAYYPAHLLVIWLVRVALT